MGWPYSTFGFRMSVYSDISNIGEDFGGTVAAFGEFKQFWRSVNKAGGIVIVQEGWMLEQIFHKGNIRTHASDAKFAQGAVHAGNGRLRSWGPSGNLFQKTIIIAGDHRTRIGSTTVKPDAHTCRPTISSNAAVIGDKIIRWIFGGNTALDGVAVEFHILLATGSCGFSQAFALRNENLSPHDIYARDFFCHRMLHLNTGVHFDEIKFFTVHVH